MGSVRQPRPRRAEKPGTNDASPPFAGLDQTDRDILRILQTDGRTPNVEIARRLKVTETTVRKRIAGMLDRGLFEIVAVPSPQMAGFNVSAIIGISVNLPSLRSVSEALVRLPEVRYCGFSTGRYDLIIEAFFSDNEHLLKFTTEMLGSMPGVTNVETSLILKIEKFSYEWEIG